MAFCRLVFPLLVLSVVNALEVPVFIWGDVPDRSVQSAALKTIESREFLSVLEKELTAEPLTVVFVEETLSSEDLSHKIDGETVYNYLHSILRKAIYLPSVQEPLAAFDYLNENGVQLELTKSGLSAKITPEISTRGSIIFINLKDVREGESRAELLKRHDTFMKDTVNKLKKSNEFVVAIYTAENPSWIPEKPHSRVRRATKDSVPEINGLRLYVEAITLKSSNETLALSTVSTVNSNINETEMSATLSYENGTSLILHFSLERGYWYFDSVILSIGAVTEDLHPKAEEVYAQDGYSYRCSQNVQFSSVNQSMDYTISFQNLKVQPFFKDTNGSEVFGDSYNCVGYFTAPIWSALFVVFILLSITFYGIMMMMDIRTMDRFDDPKGKTITINAGE